MKRRVLLIEPNYKNKYPPMSLMKISSYYKLLGDEVRFFKGDLKALAADVLYEQLLTELNYLCPETPWRRYKPVILRYLMRGFNASLEEIPAGEDGEAHEVLRDYHKKFQRKDYFVHPAFDIVAVTTLFTFYWDITIKTINFVKQLCRTKEGIKVGGIAASILPGYIFQETGIQPIVGPLLQPGALGDENDYIIDQMPLDYSILEEIEYQYPARDAYYAYMTRGCINKCDFCAVPVLEPRYQDYIPLRKEIEATKERFGEQRNLLLLDNNVLASKRYNEIIDEIKSCGFAKNDKYTPPNEYEIAIRNLRDGYNDRGYINKCIKLYQLLLAKTKEADKRREIYARMEAADCLQSYTATKEAILSLDDFMQPFFQKMYNGKKLMRIVDFNQGIDSRLVNDANMAKLAEVNIRPLRIAFDHWELRHVYEKAIRTAVAHGITGLSNYLLYNFRDKPEELYYRMEINVRLCEELNATIYSFPMKYHPIKDPNYFRNRDYIGVHWNRKFIRAIQAVLNSTKGKIGRGKSFFQAAFGENVDEFYKILWMPEAFIIYRNQYKDNLTEEWWQAWQSLSDEALEEAKRIVRRNKFHDGDYVTENPSVKSILEYYRVYSK